MKAHTDFVKDEYVNDGQKIIVQAFKEQKPTLIMGGWIGEPIGHAIYYEILPDATGKTASMRLYNTGSGLEYHDHKTEGHKTKHKAYTEWTGIAREKLESAYFMEFLYEIKNFDKHPNESLSTQYGEIDIYESLRSYLQPEEQKAGPELVVNNEHFISAQKSGVCSWKSLMAFMRTKLELNDYKRFKCDIKLQSLTDFVKKQGDVNLEDWHLVKKSHQNLCQGIMRLYQNQQVGDEYLKSAQEALKTVSQWIHQNASCRYGKPIKHVDFDYYPAPRSAVIDNKHALAMPLDEVIKSPHAADVMGQPWMDLISQINTINLSDPIHIENNLITLNALLNKAWMAGHDISLHKGIITAVLNLNMDEKFWKKALSGHPKVAEGLIVQLGELAGLFSKSCFTVPQASVIFSEKIYTLHKILYIQHMLCRVGHSHSVWKNIDLEAYRTHLSQLSSVFFGLTDAKMHREMVAIQRSRPKEKLAHAFGLNKYSCRPKSRWGETTEEPSLKDKGVNLEIKFYKSEKPPKKTNFVDLVRTEYPEVINQIMAADSQYAKLPKYAQDARIYASEFLPNWIQAMRDTSLAGIHMASSYTSPLPMLDRQKDLRPVFEVKDHIKGNDERSEITISLAGMTADILNLPDIKAIDKREYLKYARQYPKIQKAELEDFLESLYTENVDGKYSLEKQRLCHTAHMEKLTLPEEDYKDLSRLFMNPELHHLELLEYFSKSPEKLKDTDYQTLFHALLFRVDFRSSLESTSYLDKSLNVKGFSTQLANFISHNVEQWIEENDIQPAVFLLKVAHQLNTFCPHEEYFTKTQALLRGLLQRKGLEPDVKSLIYAELIAQLARKKDLDQGDIVDILAGNIYIEENRNHSRFPEDPSTLKERQEAMVVHAQAIKTALESENPNQKLLNQILQELRSQGETKWISSSHNGACPQFSTVDGKHTLYPLESKLISNKTRILLPYKIRQNPLFMQLFPGKNSGMLLKGYIYAFKDTHGRETLVHMKGDSLIIEQKLEKNVDKWYRYIPSSYFLYEDRDHRVQSELGSRYLVGHYDHWQLLSHNDEGKKEIYATDPKTGKPQYVFEGVSTSSSSRKASLQKKAKERKASNDQIRENSDNFVLHEIIDLKDKTKLGKTSKLLTSFEDASYIQEWYDNQKVVKKIELPRFGLSFKPDSSKPAKFICDQYPGYGLNTSDPVKALGMYPHYILLEKGQGQRKVLLPQQSFQAPEEKEVLRPDFDVVRQLKREHLDPQKYLEFDIDKDGRLASKSREANLYLAQVLNIAQEYQKAGDLLKKWGSKLSLYTPQETLVLDAISQSDLVTGDKSGNAAVIKLYASYQRIKNLLSHHYSPTQENIQSLNSCYHLYLAHFRHATIFKLKPEEEIFILKVLLSTEFNPSLYLRLKALDPVAAQKLEIPRQEKLFEKEKDHSPENYEIPNFFSSKSTSEKKPYYYLFTRPQKYLKEHFLYFYDVARKGSAKEKEELKQSLTYMRIVEEGRHRGLANFFEAVLENPHKFPNPVILDDKDYDKYAEQLELCQKWRKNVKTIADYIIAKQSPHTSNFPHGSQLDDITPQGFRLDETLPPMKTVNIHPHLPEIRSLTKDCVSAKCFKKVPGKDKSQTTSELSNLLQNFADQNETKAASQVLEKGLQKPVSDPKKKEISRLIEDLKIYQQQPGTPTYKFNKKGLKQIETLLAKDKIQDVQKMEEFELKILALANKKPESPEALAKLQLQKWGKLHKVITLEELLISFARNDYSSLTQRNPLLNDADLQDIAGSLGSYLLHATQQQQRTRAEAEISKLKKIKIKTEPGKYAEVTNQLAQILLAERQFKPLERPAYLVFEYFANLSIRPAQYAKLEKFLQNKDMNLVMEMIMGSGKSKVLLPLLGLMRADGKDLSMLIVPQPLFNDVSEGTQSLLQGAFSQALHSLHFDRNTQFTKETLEGILDELEHIRKNKACLIMTSKSVQCLILKFVGEYAKHFNAGPLESIPDELKLMQKILNLLSQSGYPIIDEADTVLNVLHEVSFSEGQRFSPDTNEITLISEIYNLLYTDPALKKLARLESDPSANKKAPVVTEEMFFKKIQRPLAEACLKRFGEIHFKSQQFTDKMHGYMANLKQADRKHLLDYLCRDKAHVQSAQKYYDSLDEEIQDVIALAGEQISHLLPFTLTRICDVKYGLDDKSGGIIAIPFSAANTPSSGSQFANPHITMNYTFQTYMKKGVTAKLVEDQIKLLQEKAMREVKASGGKLQIKDTLAGKTFSLLKGQINMPLFNYNPINLHELVDAINASPEAKLSFVSTMILPQMELYDSKLSCNAQNLVELFFRSSGFTGTLWNGLSMHHDLNPDPESGTDAKTLSLLWENSRTNAIVFKEGSTKNMLKQLKAQNIAFDMMSDAGGYFKEGGNRHIAHSLTSIYDKPVIFYNPEGEQTLAEASGDKPLAHTDKKPEERLTFLDQSHTTGSDVPQKLDAVGLVTIGRNMLLRDLLQAVWRLRGLDKSQQVRFLITEEVAGIIRQKLNLKDNHPIQLEAILQFAIANQADQQGKDNYKGLKQEFANLTQKILLKVLTHEKLNPKAMAQAFHHLQASWVKAANFRAKDLYGRLSKSMDSHKVLELDKHQCIHDIKEIFAKMPWLEKMGLSEKEYLEEIKIIAKRIKDHLPAKLQVPVKEIINDSTVEVEKETHTETEKETRTQLEVHENAGEDNIHLAYVKAAPLKHFDSFAKAVKYIGKKDSDSHLHVNMWKKNHCPTFSLKSYLEEDNELHAYASAFDGINLSMNVLEWNRQMDHFRLLGLHRTDFHHLLVNGSTLTLMSQEESVQYRESAHYYNLTLGFNDPKKQPAIDQQLKIVKLKFLNGESTYSPKEIELLRQWFKAQGYEKMQKLFVKHILKGHPMKAARYKDSHLEHLFLASRADAEKVNTKEAQPFSSQKHSDAPSEKAKIPSKPSKSPPAKLTFMQKLRAFFTSSSVKA